MNSTNALAFFALIVVAHGATIDRQDSHSGKPSGITKGDEDLQNAGPALETLGHFLQGKITGENESQRKEIIEALTILVKPLREPEDGSDAYFFKAIKGIVRSITPEKVASVVSG